MIKFALNIAKVEKNRERQTERERRTEQKTYKIDNIGIAHMHIALILFLYKLFHIHFLFVCIRFIAYARKPQEVFRCIYNGYFEGFRNDTSYSYSFWVKEKEFR